MFMKVLPSNEPPNRLASQETRNNIILPSISTRGKDGEASQEPYVPFGTKGIKSSHLYLGLPSRLFPSGFPTKILHGFPFAPHICYMRCP
jgi:hypothetical protein